MKVLVVIFGGADYKYIKRFNCKNLMQKEFGKAKVDNLWHNRDVATQITSQLITGETWRKSGITGRKKYTNSRIEYLEKKIFRDIPFESLTRDIREGIYNSIKGLKFKKRNYLKKDLRCKTLFEKIPNSKAIYVPSYNPEPSWALRRNILNPRNYPDLGIEGALDLLEKNFYWRKKKFMNALKKEYQLLMVQFQFIDSLQHLYMVYTKEKKWDKIKKGYVFIDNFSKKIKKNANNYDLILFISDNGSAARRYKFTHYQRPFYSLNKKKNLSKTNMRDFYKYILNWIKS